MEGSVFIGHNACLECSSSDAMGMWRHPNGRHNLYCHSCGFSIYSVDKDTLTPLKDGSKFRNTESEYEGDIDMSSVEEIVKDLSSDSLKARRIKREIAELYGVKVVYNSEGDQVGHYYPAMKDDKVVGYSKRDTWEGWEKECVKKPQLKGIMKKFSTVGYVKVDVQMFGQSLYPAPSGNGKFKSKLFITEGQEDALAGAAMIDHLGKTANNYPFISVIGGTDGGLKNLKHNLEYVTQFDEIYLCTDNDEAGKTFESEACKLLPTGKVKILSFKKTQGKDLSDIWNKPSSRDRAAGAKLFWESIWNAKSYSPAGIRSLSEGWEEYLHRGQEKLIAFPDSFGNLNELTCGGYGADGEILNIIAPSSVGKSLFVKEMVYTALLKTNKSVGVISLEETLPEFLEGLLSVHMSTQLNEIPFDERDRELEEKKFHELLSINNEGAGDRIHFVDDPGACKDEEALWNKVDFLIKGLDCTIIVLDPVTLALSLGIDEDEYTSTLVKKVKRHKLAWINVHHVRKSAMGSKANSEGADLAEEDIKGTGSHFQTGMINIILTRNKVHDNPTVRNTTKIKLSKCRRHGKNTGIAGYAYYNGDTGRLELGENPDNAMSEDDCSGVDSFLIED